MQKFLDECDYLIHLVRCAIHDLQPRELPDGMRFERVYEWGDYHQVANIAFYSVEKLQNKPEAKLYSKWENCRNQAIVVDINQSYAAQEIREALREAGVRSLEVQGTAIKPLYPQPDYRTMSDIDFIVDQENIPKVRAVLERLGYECEEVYRVELNARRPPNILVEMHTEYFLQDCQYRPVMHSPFDAVAGDGKCEINAFYLYNILHIAKHYFYSGCGIRRVLDAYYLDQKLGPCIDGAYVQGKLKRAEAAEFTEEFMSLARAWFGKEEQDLPRSKMAVYILRSGVHGSCFNEQKNQLEKTLDTTEGFSKQKYFLSRFLGNRADLQTRYPVLKRYKILYPFCWVWRLLCVLKPNRIRRIKQEVKAVKEIEK